MGRRRPRPNGIQNAEKEQLRRRAGRDRDRRIRYARRSEGRPVTNDGFEYTGGESGWQLAPHRLALRDGRFVHSADCDHELRAAATPTASEIERMNQAYPG
jgi:hypothetical protein